MSRKTLWDRIKPEVRENIEANKNKYPLLYRDTKESLQRNIVWNNLTIFEIHGISCFRPEYMKSLDVGDIFYGNCFIEENS